MLFEEPIFFIVFGLEPKNNDVSSVGEGFVGQWVAKHVMLRPGVFECVTLAKSFVVYDSIEVVNIYFV